MLLAIFIFSISAIVKKISPFEIPKVVIYWVLDDRIIYTYMQLWMQKCKIKRKIAFFMVWALPKKFYSRQVDDFRPESKFEFFYHILAKMTFFTFWRKWPYIYIPIEKIFSSVESLSSQDHFNYLQLCHISHRKKVIAI